MGEADKAGDNEEHGGDEEMLGRGTFCAMSSITIVERCALTTSDRHTRRGWRESWILCTYADFSVGRGGSRFTTDRLRGAPVVKLDRA